MLPRKARKGVERDRYVCAGRIADPSSCPQPSIRRERIDRPLLKALLDHYIDLDGTRQRIAERAGETLTLAREAVEHAKAESAKIERALAATERAFDAGDIDARQYGKREARLTSECDAAQEALRQAQGRVDSIEQTEVSSDAEGVLLQHLATLKRAVGEGVGAAPNLAAVRKVIRDLFAEVQFARNEDETYVLMPLLRSSSWQTVAGTSRPRGAVSRCHSQPRTRPTRSGRRRPSDGQDSIRPGSSRGTAGGSPRRSRTARPARSRS
jgi:hypothetical protein